MILGFVLAYIFTVVIETVILLAIFSDKGFPCALMIRNSLIVNTMTLPFVWFVFPILLGTSLGYAAQFASSELFAFAGEALLYWKLFPSLKLKDAVIASFVCNLFSFLFGLVL